MVTKHLRKSNLKEVVLILALSLRVFSFVMGKVQEVDGHFASTLLGMKAQGMLLPTFRMSFPQSSVSENHLIE